MTRSVCQVVNTVTPEALEISSQNFHGMVKAWTGWEIASLYRDVRLVRNLSDVFVDLELTLTDMTYNVFGRTLNPAQPTTDICL